MVLNNVRSVYNVGSVFRTCDATGISKVFLVGVTPTPMDRFGKFRADFAKVALGAERVVKWEKVKETSRLIRKLKAEGYEVLAVGQGERSVPYYTISRSRNSVVDKNEKVTLASRGTRDKCALIFGEETKGLPKSVLDKCDRVLEIPMRGSKESLNVSVAAGVVIYHFAVSGLKSSGNEK